MIDRELLRMLSILEEAPEGLRTKQIDAHLSAAGIDYPDIRTLQRRLDDLKERGFALKATRLTNRLVDDDRYAVKLLRLIHDIARLPDFRSAIYGDVPTRIGDLLLAGIDKPAQLFEKILNAIANSLSVQFSYKPQTEETRQKMRLHVLNGRAADANVMPVRLLPRHIVFSHDRILVLGESFRVAGIMNIFKAERRVRQYDLRGIRNFQTGLPEQETLAIRPENLYRNSLQVWIGSTVYDLTLEDTSTPGEIRKISRRVCGSEEILSLAASKIGRWKIVNPPIALVREAETRGLNADLIFRFEPSGKSLFA